MKKRISVYVSKETHNRMKNSPTILDLFCGIGGLSLGMHRAGFRSVGGVDMWQDALETFSHNLKTPTMLADVTEVGAREIAEHFSVEPYDIDVLVGGPPCQGFSTVGKREESDPRNSLWSHYLQLVAEIRPVYVVIENVEGLVAIDKGRICKNICNAFNAIGYHMKWKLLTSSHFGVPQLRKRVIFFGHLDGAVPPKFPKAVDSEPVTVAEAIFDLPELAPGECKTEYENPPQTSFQKARRGDCNVLSNHQAANHPAHLVEILKHIPDGGNRKSIPDELQPKSGFHNSYARLASNKPAIAVTSNMRKPSSARSTHPRQHRGLTAREGLRLQTFDDAFVVLGSRTSQYLQVGNAVPPIFGEQLGHAVMVAIVSNDAREIAAARLAAPRDVSTAESQQLLFNL